MPNEPIVLNDTPATRLDLLVRRASNYQSTGNDTQRPPFTRDEARKVLWNFGTFQGDERARAIFLALHDSLQSY